MVRWFIENLNRGDSRVQQMIMGAGKTTVVGTDWHDYCEHRLTG